MDLGFSICFKVKVPNMGSVNLIRGSGTSSKVLCSKVYFTRDLDAGRRNEADILRTVSTPMNYVLGLVRIGSLLWV